MASSYRLFFAVILTIIQINIFNISANDIIGCGGFIKSHVNLDFSKVEIKLFTKQGSLKEKTECAPTNGYYFLPLYEHGDYVLKVDPPPGWSIEPSEIALSVDGINDACSKGQDVNFVFSGFGITGRVVTAGSIVGPAGVSVHLISEKGDVRDTKTKFDGDFHFTPVIPGKYTVKAYHTKWKLDPASTIVQVSGGNTALKIGSIAVRGYDVRGVASSYGKPIPGLHILLYSAEGSDPLYKVEGCNTGLLQGVKGNPICYAVSADNGEFTFGLVPAGSYYVLPLDKQPGQKTVFNILPSKIDFKVEHDSVNLKNAFEVTGFTVNGLVLIHPGGTGISSAQILLDKRAVAVTDASGRYTIPNLKAGTYKLQVISDGCEFDDTSFSITTAGIANILDVFPARWKVCGNIRSPGGNTQQRKVSISSASSSSPAKIATTTDNENWCIFLAPGNYFASVQVSGEDKKDGLQFFPLSQKIAVGYKSVTGITFSQLKATITGSVKCTKDAQSSSCLNTVITLRPLSPDGSYSGQPIVVNAKDGKYVLREILPGSYEISVPTETLCWSSARHNVAVISTEATIPEFVQTGYAVSFTMSHKSQVFYTSGTMKGSLDIPAGLSQHCLPIAGEYIFTPSGCHIYEPASVTYNTRQSNSMVAINAVSHSVGISIHSVDSVNDLKLKIVNEITEEIPLSPLPQKQDGMFIYRHVVMLGHGKTAHVIPLSKLLLFSPPGIHTISAAGGDCVDVALLFTASKGKVLSGQIIPPIEDVSVILEGGGKDLRQVTESDGKYHFGPLDASLTYKLRAEKESYVLTGPDANGNFQAQKLAEIVVRIVDSSNNEPLQSALVSVSGGSYRRNLATGNHGKLSFPSLAPGEYYLKPLMKEYKFSPPHRIINIKEGETHEITLSGVRVACSGVGNVVSLGGGGLGGISIIAEPTSESDLSRCPPEEAITDRETGAFRIRGLLRGCHYKLKLKSPSDTIIAHVIPSHINLQVVSEAEDIHGLRFIAVQLILSTDISVLVYTPKIEHYKTLKLKLANEVEPTSSIFHTKLDATGFASGINPGLMISLPRVTADNKTYVIQLESTMSKSVNSYNLEPIYFNSDGAFKHFKITFDPKAKVSDQDVNQPSILILPLLGILLVAYFNQEKCLEILGYVFGLISDRFSAYVAQSRQNNAKANQYTMDDNQIDQIVQNINAIKKKPKPRKT